MNTKIEAYVSRVEDDIMFEFGKTQGSLWISAHGRIARSLKFKKGDKVIISITKK